jgi:hypothetical protein
MSSSTVQIARRDKRLVRDRHRCEIVCGSCSKIAPNRLVSSEFATQPEVTFHVQCSGAISNIIGAFGAVASLSYREALVLLHLIALLCLGSSRTRTLSV